MVEQVLRWSMFGAVTGKSWEPRGTPQCHLSPGNKAFYIVVLGELRSQG